MYASDLCETMGMLLGSGCQAYAIAVNDTPSGYHYPQRVRFEISVNTPQEYRFAADFLNLHEVDAVLVQHEFGIYGGPAGSNILRMLRELRMPVVATLHTVPDSPADQQRAAMEGMAQLVDRFVVTSPAASEILADVYGIDAERVRYIPYGIPDMPLLDGQVHREELGLLGRKVLLSFGLLSPNKGIEHMIRAMPAVVSRHPEAIYVVMGVTHPHVKAACGEEYRQGLYHLVRELGMEEHVVFRCRFVGPEELSQHLSTADVCIMPYLNERQMTSGTLAYAMGAGAAVISSPFWYARDMLADGRGCIVPFADPDALAQEASELLANDTRREHLGNMAYQHTRSMTWLHVANQYLQVVHEALADHRRSPRRSLAFSDPMSWSEIVPEPNLCHLRIMTDDVGLTQHAIFAIPDRRFGYCTDDNARALVVAMRYWQLREDPTVQPLISTYLAFLTHAFNEQRRRFRNFMSYSREWLEEVGSDDAHGRSIMALGITAELTPYESTLEPVSRLLRDSLPAVEELTSSRCWSFSIIGLDAYLRRFPEDAGAQRMLEMLAQRLLAGFERNASADWPWLEDALTWGNARVPHGLLVAGSRLGSSRMMEVALETLRWQLRLQTAPAGHLTLIGNKGWYPRGGQRASFDQQPIEVMNLAEACSAAYISTRDRSWLVEVRRCLEWFLGRNDLGKALYDPRTGGGRDGLNAAGINGNQGAESTLAWLVTLLVVHHLQAEETLNRSPGPAHPIELGNRVI